MRGRTFAAAVALTSSFFVAVPATQTPLPFPRPGQPAKPSTPPTTTAPATTPAGPAQHPVGGEPSEATLGVPIYQGAQFITSYDAGRGQRYYLFGSTGTFAEIVAFYKTALRQRGDLVFDAPATHMFDIGRFREETMAFPPSITVKDYTWGGSQGYLNPKRGAQPARFPTIIQIVPAPTAVSR